MAEEAEFTVVNEHSEAVFNAVLPTQVVFRRPAKPIVEPGLYALRFDFPAVLILLCSATRGSLAAGTRDLMTLTDE
jgi:hypothetical protein